MTREAIIDSAKAIFKKDLLNIISECNAHINVERLDGEEAEPVCIVNNAMVYNPHKLHNSGIVVSAETVKEKVYPHLKEGNLVKITSNVWPEDNGLYYIL